MTSAAPPKPNEFTLAIHGGAGTILRNSMDASREAAYHAGLRRALLARGGSALDAVTAAVMEREDEPRFNAGRGAVFTRAGEVATLSAELELVTKEVERLYARWQELTG